MQESNQNKLPTTHSETASPVASLFNQATQATSKGNNSLAIHLYLAAFEQSASKSKGSPSDLAIQSLRNAWRLAIDEKDQPACELIFERAEKFLPDDELSTYAHTLQDLTIEKLEQVGISPDELDDVADIISGDMFDDEDVKIPPFPFGKKPKDKPSKSSKTSSFKNLVGYGNAIKQAKSYGIGMQNSAKFKNLVTVLNEKHGIENMPACDTLLITSPALEDAHEFTLACAGELELPIVRMKMEETPQGSTALCVMSQAGNQPKMDRSKTNFEGPGILLIEELDAWDVPDTQPHANDLGGIIIATLSRGAGDAINLIRNAVDNPDVYVFATATDASEIAPFFLNILGPSLNIDVAVPTKTERFQIWQQILEKHPSVGAVNLESLISLSAGLPRFDICMAAQEAVEDAYKESLKSRKYVPVTPANMFEKLAAYQPLESKEYKKLEQVLIDNFKTDLENIDDILAD